VGSDSYSVGNCSDVRFQCVFLGIFGMAFCTSSIGSCCRVCR